MGYLPAYTPTFRYGVIISGANYAHGIPTEPADVIMCQTQADVEELLWCASHNVPGGYETGNGRKLAATPNYGEPGDIADVYRVNRNHPDFSEVLDEPGDRARHAFGYLIPEPAYRLTFGPRGGLRRDNF